MMKPLILIAHIACALATPLITDYPAGTIVIGASPQTAATSNQQCTNQLTDHYIFDIGILEFESIRNRKDPSCFDWASDGCSKSPDHPFSMDFESACERHDFGYRNYKVQGRFNKSTCQKINNHFKEDLDYVCSWYHGLQRPICYGLAETYYAAVVEFGC